MLPTERIVWSRDGRRCVYCSPLSAVQVYARPLTARASFVLCLLQSAAIRTTLNSPLDASTAGVKIVGPRLD